MLLFVAAAFFERAPGGFFGRVRPFAAAVSGGLVSRVHDGDTVTLALAGGGTVMARLYGLDAPELKQPYGQAARRFLREKVEGRTVRLEERERDQYGRAVALLFVEGEAVSLNEMMLVSGQAWVYRRYCDAEFCAAWLAAEKEARKNKLGLWRDKKPVPPWQWRRRHPRP
ncbi:MAG: thermonuclease family protein [Candidatus Adiutrix sp.]|nr:thermonuclease family protein [Candidatus Adiutrix sp.]